LGGWPGIHLLLQVAVLCLALRLLGARATLSIRQLLLCGALGASAGTVVLTVVQYVVFDRIDPPSAFWAWVPAQTIVVAAVVAVVSASRRRRLRLSVTDYALVGAAVAAGVATIQLLRETIVHDGPAAWYQPSIFVPIVGAMQIDGLDYWFAGPYLYGVAIGLAAGAGARLRPNSNLWVLTGAVGAIVVMADHCESIYRLGSAYVTALTPDTALSVGTTDGNGLPDFIRSATWHGRLLILVAFGGLVLASAVEGIWVSRRMPDPSGVMLPDEPRRPVTVIEWAVGWSQLRYGVSRAHTTFHYFRVRRQLLLCAAQAPVGSEEVPEVAAELFAIRSALESPAPRSPVRPSEDVLDWARRNLAVIAAVVAVLFGFVFAAGPIGHSEERDWTQQAWFGTFLLLVAGALLVAQTVRFRKWRASSPRPHDDLDVALRRWLLVAGAVCVLYGLYAWQQTAIATLLYTDLSNIVPYDSLGQAGQTFLVSWTNWGGNPVVVIAVCALLALAWGIPHSRVPLLPDEPTRVDAAAEAAVEVTA